MKKSSFISQVRLIKFVISISFLSACNNQVLSDQLPGTYTGKERVIIRYDRGGQYIYMDDYVLVSLMIDSTGHVTGMVGEATFDSCSVVQNRGWISRQLNLKTDFLIRGKLSGSTFSKDSILNKDINIPFNIVNGELKGSLFLTTKGESFPIIGLLKLKKI